MNRNPRIRHQLTSNALLGEQFRDAQQSFDAIPVTMIRQLEAVYTEPLALGTMAREPLAIELIRVLDLAAQEAPVPCGVACHYVWKPTKGGAHLTSIDGMSIAANGGKKYRFTFRLTFSPVGGFNGST